MKGRWERQDTLSYRWPNKLEKTMKVDIYVTARIYVGRRGSHSKQQTDQGEAEAVQNDNHTDESANRVRNVKQLRMKNSQERDEER